MGLYYLFSVISFCFCIFFGLQDHWQAMAIMAAIGTIILFFANLSNFKSIIIGKEGVTLERIEIETKKAIFESNLQTIKTLTGLILKTIQGSGRFGGIRDEDKIADEIREILIINKVPEAESKHIFDANWFPYIDFDNALAALGGNAIPQDLSSNPDAILEWKKLRQGGVEGRPSPATIQNFWEKHQALTPERKKLIDEYEHFLMFRKLREEPK